jgi:hypothetical protein
MTNRNRDEPMTVDGKPSTKVQVHQMHQGEARGVVAEYENEDEALKHRPNLGRSEAVLVRKKGERPRYVPIQEYLRDLKARKKS